LTLLDSAKGTSIFLRRFPPFRDGARSHDHLDDIFATLDAEKFQRCFAAWGAAVTGCPPM
jgi:hypothetical protein